MITERHLEVIQGGLYPQVFFSEIFHGKIQRPRVRYQPSSFRLPVVKLFWVRVPTRFNFPWKIHCRMTSTRFLKEKSDEKLHPKKLSYSLLEGSFSLALCSKKSSAISLILSSLNTNVFSKTTEKDYWSVGLFGIFETCTIAQLTRFIGVVVCVVGHGRLLAFGRHELIKFILGWQIATRHFLHEIFLQRDVEVHDDDV